MDSVWIGQASCGKSALNVRYMSEIPDRAQSKEVFVLSPFWDLAGSCGMETRIDGRPREGRSDNQLGGAKQCETVACNSRAYQIL